MSVPEWFTPVPRLILFAPLDITLVQADLGARVKRDVKAIGWEGQFSFDAVQGHGRLHLFAE